MPIIRAARNRMGGSGITLAQITGYGTGNKTILAKLLDANGSPTGDAIEMQVFSYPAGSDLALCAPFTAAGDTIPATVIRGRYYCALGFALTGCDR